MSSIIERLQTLYKELERMKGSGEDVVADIRAEINNLELEYLNKDIFPNIAKSLGAKLAALQCEIDFSLQFDGTGKIDYSFCTSGSSIMMRNSVECKKSIGSIGDICESDSSDSITSIISSTEQLSHEPSVTPQKCDKSSSNSSVQSKASQTNKMWIEDNFSTTFAVFGVPRDLFAEFRNKGGVYRATRTGLIGWVFPLNLKDEICLLISELEESDKPSQAKVITKSAPISHPSAFSERSAEESHENIVYMAPYTEKSFVVYGAPDKITEKLKQSGGSFSISLRGRPGWLFSNKRNLEIRSLLRDNLFTIIDGEPPTELVYKKSPSTDNNQPQTASVNANSAPNELGAKKFSISTKLGADEFREEFIKYLWKINKNQAPNYVDAIVELYVGALDSDTLSEFLGKIGFASNIYDYRDYIYIPKLLKTVEAKLNNSRKKSHIIKALKYYHRFLYFKINGREVEIFK